MDGGKRIENMLGTLQIGHHCASLGGRGRGPTTSVKSLDGVVLETKDALGGLSQEVSDGHQWSGLGITGRLQTMAALLSHLGLGSRHSAGGHLTLLAFGSCHLQRTGPEDFARAGAEVAARALGGDLATLADGTDVMGETTHGDQATKTWVCR